MARRLPEFLEVRGLSRESTRTLTQETTTLGSGYDIIESYSPPPGTPPLYPPSTLSSHHSLLSFSNPDYDSTEGFHSSGISSADSWAQDDEYDRNATKRVRAIFEDLEAALFENASGIPSNMVKECQEWTETFPHYRILGRQIFHPVEEGTKFIRMGCYDQDDINDLLDRSLNLETPLNLQLTASIPDTATTALPATAASFLVEGIKLRPFEGSYGEDEIIAQEGDNEEYLAYDKPEGYSTAAQVYYKYHQKPGYPPITPKSHRRHTIHSMVFERLWSQCMNISEPLIAKICTEMIPTTRSSRSSIDLRVRPPPPLITASPLRSNPLQDVMTIRRVPLQERSCSQQTIFRDVPPHPPPPPAPPTARLSAVKSVSGLGSLLPLRHKSREQLPPVDRTKILTFQSPVYNGADNTEVNSVVGLRGKQLRHQPRRLPPLTNSHDLTVSLDPQYTTIRIPTSSRAASAQPEDSRRYNRSYYSPEGRPNTTSSFRAHTSHHRRPPSNQAKRHSSLKPTGLEVFGASTGTAVPSKGSKLAVVESQPLLPRPAEIAVVDSNEFANPKPPPYSDNLFSKPGPVWITGVQGAKVLRRTPNVR